MEAAKPTLEKVADCIKGAKAAFGFYESLAIHETPAGFPEEKAAELRALEKSLRAVIEGIKSVRSATAKDVVDIVDICTQMYPRLVELEGDVELERLKKRLEEKGKP